MKLLTPLLLFLTLNIQAQIEVPILDFHKITVDDSISYKAIDKFVGYMERNPIQYEDAIRKIKEVRMVQADRYFTGELQNGVISLNNRLNKLPYTKQVVLLQIIAVNNGMVLQNSHLPAVYNRNFSMTEDNEKDFARYVKRNTVYIQLVKLLTKQSPLR